MAKGFTITLVGFERTQQALRQAPEQATALLAKAVATTTFATMQRASALAPVSTGTLRGALRSSTRGLNGRVTIGPEAFYWRFIEYGTKFQPARPFVRTAAEMEANDFIERVRDVGVQLERDFATSRFL